MFGRGKQGAERVHEKYSYGTHEDEGDLYLSNIILIRGFQIW